MNRTDNLERELTAWFADTAAPRVPDFTDDILRLTAGTRQRPRWSVPERWLPMSVITLGRRTFKPLPWRTIGLLAVIAMLIAVALAFYVGSQPRLPAPFGIAANGLVAYAQGGDIYAVDPTTGARHAIATAPEQDREPRFSLDGTRVAFVRSSGTADVLVIADPRRPEQVVAMTQPFIELDIDSIAWSPDGRSITVGAQDGASQALYIVDAVNGSKRRLAIDYAGLDVYWRPPDGRQLMFFGRTGLDVGLLMVDVDDGTVTEVARPALPGEILRPSGWTPDGQRVLYLRGHPSTSFRTHVLDLATREEIIIDAAFGHVSNDGTRMVALDELDRMCVANLVGGQCVPIGQVSQAYSSGHAAGAQWSPDDQWIISRPATSDGSPSDASAVLLDPDGGTQDQPSWIANGAVSWQRLAP